MKGILKGCAAMLVLGALTSVAQGQGFTNAGFDDGTLSGWDVHNTGNGVGAPGTVEMFDIDGSGPLGMSNAAKFSVAEANFTGQQEGVEMVQTMTLSSGVPYTFSYDWCASDQYQSGNAEGGVFDIIMDGNIVAQANAGSINSGQNIYGSVSVTITGDGGSHVMGARITRPYTSPGALYQYVDNFLPAAGGGYTISTSGTCPGNVTVNWSGAANNVQQALVFGLNQGNTVIPNGPCAGTALGVSGGVMQIGGYINSGANGSGSINGNAGAFACGHWVQMIQGGSCTTSNTAQLP